MDVKDYQRVCSEPSVFRKNKVAQIQSIVEKIDPELSKNLLNQRIIEKPISHSGDSDWVRLEVSLQSAESIADIIALAEAEAISEAGETTDEASQISDLLDEWQCYVNDLAKTV